MRLSTMSVSACSTQSLRVVDAWVTGDDPLAGQSEREHETGREHEYRDGHEDEAEEVPV